MERKMPMRALPRSGCRATKIRKGKVKQKDRPICLHPILSLAASNLAKTMMRLSLANSEGWTHPGYLAKKIIRLMSKGNRIKMEKSTQRKT